MDNNLEFKKIKSIKRLDKKQKVYNFNVPGLENYVANGFVVHNCENYKHSQVYNKSTIKKFSAEEIVGMAIEKHCESVCMTYNEPTLYYEYLLDVADECHYNNLKFVLKTNAYINKEPWEDVCKVTDAMNIDWKGSDLQYREVTGANDCVIRERIKEAKDLGVYLEISIPLYYNFLNDVRVFYECGSFLSTLGRDIPCHLLKIFPANEYEKYRSTSDLLASTADMILSFYMDNVYVSDN